MSSTHTQKRRRMSYWFHPVDDSRNYRFSNSRMISNFWGLDYLRTSLKPWSWCEAYSFNCVFTLCTKRTPIICKKSEWQFLLLFLHWTLSSSIIACAMGMRFTKPLDLPLPLFFFSIAHTSEWVGMAMTFWQAWDTQKENGLSHFLFFLFWFIWFTSPLSLLPSGWMSMSFPSPRKLFFLFKKKKNYFGHDGMSFLFFFFEEEERRKLWSPLPFGKAYLPTPTCSFVPPFFSLVRGGR